MPNWLHVTTFTAGFLALGVTGVACADTIDLGSVGVGGGPGLAPTSPAGGALPTAAAPTVTPLGVTQPTSVIGESYIRNAVPPSGAYDTIVRIAPSVMALSPNGPGLGEASDLTIRGFSDGQYNVTFDGIPFADSDDFTHHSNAYFSSHLLNSVSVDRGPGTASTVGSATFGGTIALSSRNPAASAGAEAYTSVGSFGTHVFGAHVDSGAVGALNGGSLLIGAERLDTNGYLTGVRQSHTSTYVKAVQPLSDNTLLTVFATTLWQDGGQSPGATRAQIATYGPNYALSNNPTSQNYTGFNQEHYQTDFEYLGLQSQLSSGLTLDNKAYTYGLYRHFNTGLDANGDTPNGTAYGPLNVPGTMSRNDLRALGDIVRLEGQVPFGTLRVGLWAEHQTNARSQYFVDETLGGALNPVLPPVAGVAGSAAIYRLQRDTLDTLQPYAELDWKISPALTVTAGLKYAVFHRSENSPVNEGTRLPLNVNVTYDAPVPALAIHEQFSPEWAGYAQIARGFLAPQLQFLDVPDPKANRVAPETTVNYQLGTSWQHGPFTLSGDGYYIDFNNMVGSRTVGGEAQVFNEGGVNYLGLEGDATVRIGSGVSLYCNGSVNSARQRSGGASVPNTPVATAAGGVLYEQGAWYGAIIDKWVGTRYGDVNRQEGLQPFNQLDANLSWRWAGRPGQAPAIKAQLAVQNLLDQRKIVSLAGYTATGGTPLYYTQAGRAVFLTVTVQF